MSITLTSGDDKNFEITEDAYKKCPYIQRMVEGGNTSLKFDDIKGEVLVYRKAPRLSQQLRSLSSYF